jgi:N6-adenosine-specific RNA methylase IME4
VGAQGAPLPSDLNTLAGPAAAQAHFDGKSEFSKSSSADGGRSSSLTGLALYDAARRALAEARSVDEVKDIHDTAVAMRAYARQAKNHELEADAVALRMRATRQLAQLIEAQKETVGLNTGAAGGGKKTGPRGLLLDPRDVRPTLASQGIDKALAHQARVLGRLSDSAFEDKVEQTRQSVGRVVRRVVREVELEEKREEHRARTFAGCTVADLEALAASGQRFGVIIPDPPWPWDTYSDRGKIQTAPDNHYGTMTLAEIARIPVARLAADDCALLLWCTAPHITKGNHIPIIEAWGFKPSTFGFVWIKTEADGSLTTGQGYSTRSNSEVCLLAFKGSPTRLAADVNQVVMAPVGAHSEKPDEVYHRLERLYPGPYLELFARRTRPGWWVWGDEIAPTDMVAKPAP